MRSTDYVAWWKLENLFDEENSPRRTEKLQRATGADFAGWTPPRRDRKVAQLASVIAQMHGGAGLGPARELRSREPLRRRSPRRRPRRELPGRNYAVVHADTDDARGIDVAFIYDPGLLQAPDDQVFFHVVIRRNASRELVQVNFQTPTNGTWAVFGNHWPWRSGASLSPPAPRHRGGDAQLLPPARARGPRRDAPL